MGHIKSCKHPGCLNHTTHPCERCGRINGKSKWIVQVKGEKCSNSFEISVVREDNKLGRKSWGWFDTDKLLVTHNGGPCNWPLTARIWDKMLVAAHEVADEMNKEEGYV